MLRNPATASGTATRLACILSCTTASCHLAFLLAKSCAHVMILVALNIWCPAGWSLKGRATSSLCMVRPAPRATATQHARMRAGARHQPAAPTSSTSRSCLDQTGLAALHPTTRTGTLAGMTPVKIRRKSSLLAEPASFRQGPSSWLWMAVSISAMINPAQGKPTMASGPRWSMLLSAAGPAASNTLHMNQLLTHLALLAYSQL